MGRLQRQELFGDDVKQALEAGRHDAERRQAVTRHHAGKAGFGAAEGGHRVGHDLVAENEHGRKV